MEILKYLSNSIKEQIIKDCNYDFKRLEEIRLRNCKNIILKFNENEEILNYIVQTKDILETLEKITENSIYTYEKQIANGFITLPGGHRVGITGNAVIENEKVISISHISGMNFRIAKQIIDCSNSVLKKLYEQGEFKNTIIVGAPGTGKTTILKDLIKKISEGNMYGNGINVGVVDERNEISAMHRGKEEINLGIRTDVITNIPKNIGIKMLIRSMAPKVIAVDEIGGKKDAESINYASKSGVKVLTTIHGNSLADVKNNKEINEIIENKLIEEIIVLDEKQKGKIKESYYLNKEKNTYEREKIWF